ncbi:MAG TPA: siderophore-interacting protein [Rhodanobacter sp.]|nr:siderophore-interacting protein [Rhodanobacter sp.]
MPLHVHQKLRHELVKRTLQVVRVQRLSPHMQRVTFAGDELRGFVSAAPDDHMKLFFPNSHGDIVPPVMGPNGPSYPPGREYSPMRDYTPRAFDPGRNELTIDFVLHGDGPASHWAARAATGQQLVAGGPRGSFVVADDFDHYVLVGDETALPAIGRWLEEMPASAHVLALIEIPEVADRQPLESAAALELRWLDRNGASGASSRLLEQALQQITLPEGDSFHWIATESRRARAMRQWLDEHRQVPKDWIRATGYWSATSG